MRNILLLLSTFLFVLSCFSPVEARRSRKSRPSNQQNVAVVPKISPQLQAELNKLNAEYRSQVISKEEQLLKKKARLESKKDGSFFAKKYNEARLGFVKMELDELETKKTVFKKRFEKARATYK